MHHTEECKEGGDSLEVARSEDTAHLAWFEVQVKGVELENNETVLLLERCGYRAKLICKFPGMIKFLQDHDVDYCIDTLAKRFVYAQISSSIIIEMKTFKQPPVTEETILPQDWSASNTPTTFRVHAPFRGRESGGMRKCPNCGADTETIIVRTRTRCYHKCMKCCVLMETVGGKLFS